MIYEIRQTEKAAPLFEGWQETMIWSCLQQVMGKLYVDSLESPASAMALVGDFCFLAGIPDREMLLFLDGTIRRGFQILVPGHKEWGRLIEDIHDDHAKKVIRYATKKELDFHNHFKKDKLQAAVDALPDGYILKMIDEDLFWHCKNIEWCRDWVSQYKDYSVYRKFGLGAVILKEGEPVSGASSYSGYHGGIEVEIDTRKDYQRRGLACICGAKLILECLKRGWYPGWDAQNRGSLALAEKLGYQFSHEYTAYEIRRRTDG